MVIWTERRSKHDKRRIINAFRELSASFTVGTNRKKVKSSKQITVDLLPITWLPPRPNALLIPPLVGILSASFPSSFYQHINKHIHSLHLDSFPLSDELDILRRESEEEGVLSRRVLPTSSNIGNTAIVVHLCSMTRRPC